MTAGPARRNNGEATIPFRVAPLYLLRADPITLTLGVAHLDLSRA